MSDEKKPTAAARLEKHNDALLIKSAAEKLKAGKRLTKAEIAAASKAEKQQAQARELPYLQNMPKGDYLALFGGSSKVYIDWQKVHGFPWTPDSNTVDAVEIHKWYRTAFASDAQLLNDQEFLIRKKQAEVIAAEAEARIKARKAEREEKRFVRVEVVRSQWATFLSVFRDAVLSIPDDIKPTFPVEYADTVTAEFKRKIIKALTALADRPVADFAELQDLNDAAEE